MKFITIFLLLVFYILFKCFKLYKIYDQKKVIIKYDDIPIMKEKKKEDFKIEFEPFNNTNIYEFGIFKTNYFRHPNELDLFLSELLNNMTILDLGCGMLESDLYFLEKYKKLKIHAVTRCEKKYEKEILNIIKSKNVSNNIFPYFKDFDKLGGIFEKNFFDRILFIESINYSKNINNLLTLIRPLLKNNGKIYIRTIIKPKTDSKYLNKKYKEIEDKLNFKLYTHENIISLLQMNNFIDIKYSSIPLLFSDNFSNIFFYLTLRKLKLLSFSYFFPSLSILSGIYIATKKE
tara:strand:+ start:727 stop:1596 length:870 start_codon:yes stop_codon:yes gene_type:complete